MPKEAEVEFTFELLEKLRGYFEKYTLAGRRLQARPDGRLQGKVPDIVVEERGVPVLIIETKRKAEEPLGESLNPLGPAPIAQAACYAALAMLEYKLERTPLFATANRDFLVLFKGIERSDLEKVLDVDACLETKRTPDDWAKALRPGALSTLLNGHIIAHVEDPLSDAGIKKLCDALESQLVGRVLPAEAFYEVFVSAMRKYVEDLSRSISGALKARLLDDAEFFKRLHAGLQEMGYAQGLLSRGILSLVLPPSLRERQREAIREILEGALRRRLAEDGDAFRALRAVSGMTLLELYEEAGRVEQARRLGMQTVELLKATRVRGILSFENLARMMAYALANKVLAYKVLELHYGDVIPPLRPVGIGASVTIGGKEHTVEKPDDLVELLNSTFKQASSELEEKLGMKDFSPLFNAGPFDEVVLGGLEAVEKVNKIIELVDGLKPELRHLPGVIGYVFEGLLPPGERHQLGEFYTPPAVARLIARWAIRSGEDKVLDAGCGSGTFLIEAYKRLLLLKYGKDYSAGQYPSCTERFNEHQGVLDQLYGVDVNAFATQLTGVHLMLMEPRCPISRLNLETRDFFSLKRSSLGELRLPDHFEAVVGNPPYTRWVEIPGTTQDLILRELGDELDAYDLRADTARGREPGIYVYWVMHACKNLLTRGGRLGLIISNAWLQTDYGVGFGRFLLDNFRVRALIDLSFRLFEATISTVILLAEKEPDGEARDNNVITFVRIPPRLKGGEELDPLKAGKLLDEVLRCVEDAIGSDGSLDARALTRCAEEYGVQFTQIRQGDVPKDKKWISLFFTGVEELLSKLEKHQLVTALGEWFEPSYGNALYLCLASWGIVRGVRNLGAKEFFYFSTEKIDEWESRAPGFNAAAEPYLAPAITRSQNVPTFTFTRADWESLRDCGSDAYIFVCHEAVGKLPPQVREYIRWGETECRTKIRGTRGGGEVCSEAEACRARAGNPKVFKGWYDLGGYLPTPLMAVRQPRYHPRFFYVDFPVVTYDAIIALIPKVKVKAGYLTVDPSDFIKERPYLSSAIAPRDVELGETELKALLAYLNSTFVWLWLEQNARYVPKGPLGLEVNVLRRMPVLNVKGLDRADVEALAKAFDSLEEAARTALVGAQAEEEEEGDPCRSKGKRKSALEAVAMLKPHFQEIDRLVAGILGLGVDAEQLWDYAWEMMERRVKGARGPARPGAEVSLDIGRQRGDRRRSPSGGSADMPLDKWL
ncbi:N-6 DNA methylase [Infirmifilum sp. SLHALR2]|nr:MAG: hypothetical protein B7L53_07955 [Thermofilum sp. NZ13]